MGTPKVAGNSMNGTIADWERRVKLAIQREQERPLPDNATISVLCDAIRLSREYLNLMEECDNAAGGGR